MTGTGDAVAAAWALRSGLGWGEGKVAEAAADTNFANGAARRVTEGGAFGAVASGGLLIGMSVTTRGWSTVGNPIWAGGGPPVVGAASAS